MKVSVRPLREDELDEADRIIRLAFGTFLGLPDPLAFMGDAGFVRTRWRADPAAALAAEVGGELVGSNFAANWGSFGFFGPLTVRPDLWDRGVARRLLEATMALFERWGTRHVGPVHLPAEPEAPRPVPGLRLLAAVPHAGHVEGGRRSARRGRLVGLQRACRSGSARAPSAPAAS